MKVTNLVSVVVIALAATACATQKPASSQVAAVDDGSSSDQFSGAKKLISCKRDGAHGAFTSFVITADQGETGPIYTQASGKLVVSGGIAQFIANRAFQCTNQLAQPQFIGPYGGVTYLWSCQSLALDGSGNVATQPDEMETISIVAAGGKITATLDAGLGQGDMDCAK